MRFFIMKSRQTCYQRNMLSFRIAITFSFILIAFCLQSCRFSFSDTPNSTATSAPTTQAKPSPTSTHSVLANVTMTPATRASGYLAFFNYTTRPITLQGNIIYSKHGIAIQFSGPVTVPVIPDRNSPAMKVSASAVVPGSQGNIPADRKSVV